jgi:hypothetical protein
VKNMATSEEPIVVQIVNESGLGTTTAGKGGGGGGMAGLGKLAGVTAAVTTMATATTAILAIAAEAMGDILKPVKTVIGGIFKLISQILRPVVDLLLLLLIPFLNLWKPIIKVFTDIMRPFRTVAYKLMAEANKAGGIGTTAGAALQGMAISTLIAGFIAALVGFIGETLKTTTSLLMTYLQLFVIDPILTLLTPIIEFFGGNVDEIKANIGTSLASAQQFINSGIDATVKGVKDTAWTVLKMQADAIDLVTPGVNAKQKFEKAYNDFWDIQYKKAAANAAASSVNMRVSNDTGGSNPLNVGKVTSSGYQTMDYAIINNALKNNGGAVKKTG